MKNLFRISMFLLTVTAVIALGGSELQAQQTPSGGGWTGSGCITGPSPGGYLQAIADAEAEATSKMDFSVAQELSTNPALQGKVLLGASVAEGEQYGYWHELDEYRHEIFSVTLFFDDFTYFNLNSPTNDD